MPPSPLPARRGASTSRLPAKSSARPLLDGGQPGSPGLQPARPARAGQRQVREPSERARRPDRRREGRPQGLRNLDHGPDDARRGDGRFDHHSLRGPLFGAGAAEAGGARRGPLRGGVMPRQVTAFSNSTVKRLRSLREKKARRAEGLFLAEGLRILTEARDSGRLPEIVAFSAEGAKHPLAGEIIAAVEAAGGDAVETTPDILSKMSGKDNPQMLLGAYRQPEAFLAQIDRSQSPLWLV